jgi:hypothetical protein
MANTLPSSCKLPNACDDCEGKEGGCIMRKHLPYVITHEKEMNEFMEENADELARLIAHSINQQPLLW